MTTYYRIQPAGLGLDHKSEDSAGETTSLHVFGNASDTIHCEGCPADYGDQVVEIEGGKSWDNGDVEGVAIDPVQATVVGRFTLDEFARKVAQEVAGRDADDFTAQDFDEVSMAYADCPMWYVIRHSR